MTLPGDVAESLISELSIAQPGEIDLDAIAHLAGVEVRYGSLKGCEATLVGVGNRAIATIRESDYPGRTRFSVGHELGHWKLHRGRSFTCRVDEIDLNLSSDRKLEKEADTFSAHLLMPAPLFVPRVTQLGKPGFKQLAELSSEFGTSLLATSLRLKDVDTLPVLFACFDGKRLAWALPAAHIPPRWMLKRELDEDTFAYDLVTKGTECLQLRKQPADSWFANPDADSDNYEVEEACVRITRGRILVMLYFNADMMEAGFDRNVGVRKFDAQGEYFAGIDGKRRRK